MDIKQYLVVLICIFSDHQYNWNSFHMFISCLSIKVVTLKIKQIKQRLKQDTFIPLPYDKLNLSNPVSQYSSWGSGSRFDLVVLPPWHMISIPWPNMPAPAPTIRWMFLKAAHNTDPEISFHTDGVFKHHPPALTLIFVSKNKSR